MLAGFRGLLLGAEHLRHRLQAPGSGRAATAGQGRDEVAEQPRPVSDYPYAADFDDETQEVQP
ncbi:hypothetical protein [Streptomyces sp. NPDC053542]|uniref:hypothetical protein n=1 Tax=Streptomyces sp. NPDC053542 TaxID=3365710 RepID=UPI0037D10D27